MAFNAEARGRQAAPLKREMPAEPIHCLIVSVAYAIPAGEVNRSLPSVGVQGI